MQKTPNEESAKTYIDDNGDDYIYVINDTKYDTKTKTLDRLSISN